MAKSKRGTILKRLGGLVPDVESIVELYELDQERAKLIQEMLQTVETAMAKVLSSHRQIISDQEAFIDEQTKTAHKIERQLGRERDARTILSNIDVFLAGESASVQYVLEQVFLPIFAEAFGNLEPERQRALFASLREAVNSLQKTDGILAAPKAEKRVQ